MGIINYTIVHFHGLGQGYCSQNSKLGSLAYQMAAAPIVRKSNLVSMEKWKSTPHQKREKTIYDKMDSSPF